MNKLLASILSFTKIGKVATKVQTIIAGYKTYIVGAGIAVPALLTILNNYGEQGTPYLLGVSGTPEYTQLLAGLGVITGRAAISKMAPKT